MATNFILICIVLCALFFIPLSKDRVIRRYRIKIEQKAGEEKLWHTPQVKSSLFGKWRSLVRDQNGKVYAETNCSQSCVNHIDAEGLIEDYRERLAIAEKKVYTTYEEYPSDKN